MPWVLRVHPRAKASVSRSLMSRALDCSTTLKAALRATMRKSPARMHTPGKVLGRRPANCRRQPRAWRPDEGDAGVRTGPPAGERAVSDRPGSSQPRRFLAPCSPGPGFHRYKNVLQTLKSGTLLLWAWVFLIATAATPLVAQVVATPSAPTRPTATNPLPGPAPPAGANQAASATTPSAAQRA